MPVRKPVAEPEYTDMGGAAGTQLRPGELRKIGFANARRVQESLSAGVERRVLRWLAERTPAWINSDHLTAMGFAGMLLAGASYAAARWDRRALLLATFFLAVNWLGDSLDGTLARFRNRQRPRYGFYLDHMVDTFGALFLMGGLAFSGYLHWGVAIGMLVAFLMLSIEVYLTTYTLGNFQLSYGIFGPTEIRILLAVGNITLLYRPTGHLLGHAFPLFDIGGVIAIAGMTVILVVSTVRHVAELYRQESLS